MRVSPSIISVHKAQFRTRLYSSPSKLAALAMRDAHAALYSMHVARIGSLQPSEMLDRCVDG